MKKIILISAVLCLFFIGCNKTDGKKSNQVIHSDGKSVEVTGSNQTVTVDNDAQEIVIKGDNNQVSTKDSE